MHGHLIRNLPSLNALRAFEASARHLSFTMAARELCVTPGAVSRQVKLLEETVQVTLFHRLHRQLILTDQGQMLQKPLNQAFELMATSLERLKNQPRDLKLKVHPSFAIRWLIPRLHRFQTLHPDIQVRLTTSSVNVDFSRENFDVGITYRGDKVAGVRREIILEERLTPVCSPALLNGKNPLDSPDDLTHYLLLHNNLELREWRTWAKAVGARDLPVEQGQIFEVDDAALQAAASGLGIALGDLCLIREDLETGRLVRPFDGMVVKIGTYYIAWPDVKDTFLGVTTFREWVMAEMEAECHGSNAM